MLAERFGVSETKMQSMMRRLDGKDISLDQPVYDDSGATMLDTLVSPDVDQESETMNAERKTVVERRLAEAMSELDKRERYIVEQRFLGDDEVSLAAIGRKLGVSRERARQLEARAKKKLQKRLSDISDLAVA